MNDESRKILATDSILENLTKTVLYEGYSIFPYHRSAIKNQKPIPFGVIYPGDYHACNQYAPSLMQTECIVTGKKDLSINIKVRFLHLIKTEIYHQDNKDEREKENTINELSHEGWQTIERTITSGDWLIANLLNSKQSFTIDFDSIEETKYSSNDSDLLTSKQINSVEKINGAMTLEAFTIEDKPSVFRLRVTVINNSFMNDTEKISQYEAFRQSFISTNTILKVINGEFVSEQNPPENFKSLISKNKNIGTWPILIEESNTTMLSSPIILYDYPKINAQSKLDMFDSLEIEEMLILHLSAMSEEEKNHLAKSDEKMKAMLEKARQVTPEELLNLHGVMFENENFKI